MSQTVILDDVLAPGLKIVFCGTRVGRKSAQDNAYYASASNKFWAILFKVGLTPKMLLPCEYKKLLTFDIGLTDIAKNSSGGDRGLPTTKYDVDDFLEKIDQFHPKVLAFNGKKAAKIYFDCREVEYGEQTEAIGGTAIFVLPSTSGAASRYWNEKYWSDLAKYI
jgi:TDG/mug DNA glycosylase family protein